MCGLPPSPGPKTCQGLPRSAPARPPTPGPRPPGCHPHRSSYKVSDVKNRKVRGADSALPWVPGPSAPAPMAVRGRGFLARLQSGGRGAKGAAPQKQKPGRRYRPLTVRPRQAVLLLTRERKNRRVDTRTESWPRAAPASDRRPPAAVDSRTIHGAQRARKSGCWERRSGRWGGSWGAHQPPPPPPPTPEGEGREGRAQRRRQQLPWRSDCSRTPSISAMMTRSARPSWSAL